MRRMAAALPLHEEVPLLGSERSVELPGVAVRVPEGNTVVQLPVVAHESAVRVGTTARRR